VKTIVWILFFDKYKYLYGAQAGAWCWKKK